MELIKNIEYSIQVDGTIRLLENTTDAAYEGMIRWTGSDLEGYVASQWVSLTGITSGSISHTNLIDLQGGATSEYFHLDESTYDDVNSLSSQIYSQLANIGSSNISAAQWELLSFADQNTNSSSAPSFSNLNITSLSDGILRLSGGYLATGDVNLSTEVTGVLPVYLGGTNSISPLANGFVMISDSDKIVESAIPTSTLNLLLGINGIEESIGSPSIDNDLLTTKGYVDSQISNSEISVTNGLSITDYTIRLGGTLIQETTIFGNGQTFNLGWPTSKIFGLNMYVSEGMFLQSDGTITFSVSDSIKYQNEYWSNYTIRSLPDVGWVLNEFNTRINPIANGGTNSSAALSNDRVMISTGGAIVESPTISTSNLSVLSGITGISLGTSDNDKYVTQGYVDDRVSDFGIITVASEAELIDAAALINSNYIAGEIIFENNIYLTADRTINLEAITLNLNGYTLYNQQHLLNIQGNVFTVKNGSMSNRLSSYTYRSNITENFKAMNFLGDAASFGLTNTTRWSIRFENIEFTNYVGTLSDNGANMEFTNTSAPAILKFDSCRTYSLASSSYLPTVLDSPLIVEFSNSSYFYAEITALNWITSHNNFGRVSKAIKINFTPASKVWFYCDGSVNLSNTNILKDVTGTEPTTTNVLVATFGASNLISQKNELDFEDISDSQLLLSNGNSLWNITGDKFVHADVNDGPIVSFAKSLDLQTLNDEVTLFTVPSGKWGAIQHQELHFVLTEGNPGSWTTHPNITVYWTPRGSTETSSTFDMGSSSFYNYLYTLNAHLESNTTVRIKVTQVAGGGDPAVYKCAGTAIF